MTEPTITCPNCKTEIKFAAQSCDSNNDQELRLKLYGETRADLLKRQLSNSENTDRAILSVSTAALGFSLAFLNDFILNQSTVCIFLLYTSWVLFVLAIISTVLSFFTSQKAIDEQLVLAHKYYLERHEASHAVRTKCAKVTDILNKLGAVLLVSALICTCVFVGLNFSKGNGMTDKIKLTEGVPVQSAQKVGQVSDTVNKGAPIATMQTIPVNPQNAAPVPTMQQVPVSAPATQPTTPAQTESSE